jgi:uncharacterized protein YodC (DUF2158 family)
MATPQFKYEKYTGKPEAGDVVRLRAGGLPMTVESGTEGEAKCVWFDKNDKLRRGTFRANVLEKRNDE